MDNQSVKKSDQGLTTTQIVAICIFVLLVIVIVIVYFVVTGKQVEKPVVVPDEEFCPPGTFSPDFGYGPNCTKCPVGKYSSKDGSTKCDDCEVGEYSDAGATICKTLIL
jgi:hypothetical protein